jgi:hypothetical protein
VDSKRTARDNELVRSLSETLDEVERVAAEATHGGLGRWHLSEDPSAALHLVAAHREIVATISSWKHTVCEDPWYTCSAAEYERDGGERAGRRRADRHGVCDCGRDERVAAILTKLAESWGIKEQGDLSGT